MTCPNPDSCICDCHNGWQRPCSLPGGCGLGTTDHLDRALHRIHRRRQRIATQLTDLGDDIHELTHPTGYISRVAALVTADATPLVDTSDTCSTSGGKKVTGSPAPWNDTAAGWLFDVHAGARRHEAQLRAELAFRPATRSSSDRSTLLALRALPDLCAAVLDRAGRQDIDLNRVDRTIDDVAKWARDARQILDDDARPGDAEPTHAPGGLKCPHCDRRLVLKPGWQLEKTPAVWCLRCPASVDDDHPRPRDLSWAADAWLAALQDDTG